MSLKDASLKNKNVFRNLQISSIFFLVLFFVFGLLNHIFVDQSLSGVATGVRLIQQTSQMIESSQNILFNLFTAYSIQNGLSYSYDTKYNNKLPNNLAEIQQAIQQSVSKIDENQKYIQQNQINYRQEHTDQLQKYIIRLNILENGEHIEKKFNLHEMN